ncbi:MAG TPA: phospho-N-acetylmuramoyl-pentapeptide-transferase [Candidatus Limnocylindria bacterium]|nr:phospho-N-acetylmuramoyl-pentapeptide-transferase [Candidatus Limnocylindria bacterium]
MAYSVLTKIFSLTSLAFIFALVATPLFTTFLYKNKLGKQIRNDGTTPLFSEMHKGKAGVPTMGGILVWGTLLILMVSFWFLDHVLHIAFFSNFDFYSRRETLLPLGALLGASFVGLLDDWLDVRQLGHKGRGLRFMVKIWLYALVAVIGAWWFYFKLGFDYINIPFAGNLHLGWVFLPFFILVVVATSFSVNQTDGLDGLAGGTLMISFFAFGLIAFLQGKHDLATFIGVICGGLLAFLWFNVFPARFIMGDTGSMGLGVLLAIVAFLTNSILLLPIIGFVFVIEAVSTILQIFYKKYFKKKLFLSAPLHHHFEALGWPEAKVTMRLWIVAAVTSIIGVIIYFIG